MGRRFLVSISLLLMFFFQGWAQAHKTNTAGVVHRELSNLNASQEARDLYARLLQYHADKKILSGQMWAPWGIDEIKYVYEVTGKYPALRGHDLIHESSNAREIELLIDWYRKGGIPTLMWHWGAPSLGEGYEQSKLTIDISKCFIEGTPEHKAMWDDLKRVADWLTVLRDANVPVLWRPMHEFDGKWFWYGKGSGMHFVKLWETMYNYFTKDRELNNLIWVLCHSDKLDVTYVPDKKYFDFAGPDTYTKDSQEKLYHTIADMYGKDNLIPLHECGTIPDPDICLKNNTMWSWWMLWHTMHLTKMDKDELRRIYNHPAVLTLDELKEDVLERILLDENWQFAFGNASDPVKDFGAGTEYFNYFAKANSIHNKGPYSSKFDATDWNRVNLPHDWVVDLPFSPTASHSHGYKTVGYKYPETSVGWYRKTFKIGKEDLGKNITLQFDGIFRDATVWVNGFYVGNEPSGYAAQVYDITDYLNYGGENLIAVRVDATFEEGWFYEGAGIYRHVWLHKTSPIHVATFGTFVYSELQAPFTQAQLKIETTVENSGLIASNYQIIQRLIDAEGNEVAKAEADGKTLLPKEKNTTLQQITVNKPHLWNLEDPYLYTVITELYQQGKLVDTYSTKTGIRHIRFDANEGFFLNGKNIKLKGVNMHQDHAGVGSAIPDALQEYRIKQLKSFGCNAYRASHNPMTPEMLDVCDREGMLVISENRLMGINQEHLELQERMIKRDRNHPSIILWSIGNEEWGIESKESGIRIAATMREHSHRIDPTRMVTAGISGGNQLLKSLDVVGYNYINQNPVEKYHTENPEWKAVGTEETTGAGSRGVYFDDKEKGHMRSLNRSGVRGVVNVIERGWKFYAERPYLGGIFYWTGFDYRGEPNPLSFPATGSQFGILDYCGFEKDEAYYLKSWWTDEPVLHILPHWNLKGHEGDTIDVWAYSNCDEVELTVNGKNLGRKKMEKNGHLSWKTIYQPGVVKAVGYKNRKRVLTQTVSTTDSPSEIVLSAHKTELKADQKDVAVVKVELKDKQGRFVPDTCVPLTFELMGEAHILGVGNGDPAFQDEERPKNADARTFHIKTFNGLAQILIQSKTKSGTVQLKVKGENLPESVLELHVAQ